MNGAQLNLGRLVKRIAFITTGRKTMRLSNTTKNENFFCIVRFIIERNTDYVY